MGRERLKIRSDRISTSTFSLYSAQSTAYFANMQNHESTPKLLAMTAKQAGESKLLDAVREDRVMRLRLHAV